MPWGRDAKAALGSGVERAAGMAVAAGGADWVCSAASRSRWSRLTSAASASFSLSSEAMRRAASTAACECEPDSDVPRLPEAAEWRGSVRPLPVHAGAGSLPRRARPFRFRAKRCVAPRPRLLVIGSRDSGCWTEGAGGGDAIELVCSGASLLTLEPAHFGRKRRFVAFELRNAALRVSDGFGGGRGRWRRGRGTGDGLRPSGDWLGRRRVLARLPRRGLRLSRRDNSLPIGRDRSGGGLRRSHPLISSTQQRPRNGRYVLIHHQECCPHQAGDKHRQRRQSGD